MRFVRRKLYRAFPEFDPYTDEECALFLDQMRDRGRFFLPDGTMLVVTGTLFAAFYLIDYLRVANNILDAMTPEREYVPQSLYVIQFIVGISLIAVPSFLCLWMGFLARDSLLQRAIRRFLDRTLCLDCGYSLLGQSLNDNGHVRCPECGRESTLSELGLQKAEQLLPPGVKPRTPTT